MKRSGPLLLVAAIASATLAADAKAPAGDPRALGAWWREAQESATHEDEEALLAALETGEDSEGIQLAQAKIDGASGPRETKEALFRVGDELFDHVFHAREGLGDRPYARLRRVHAGVRGGLDTYSCAGCHSSGGVDGAGAETQNAFVEGDGERTSAANVRNPPALLGLGFVQALAAEMSAELATERGRAVDAARARGADVTARLSAKGVDFGALVARADGSVDARGVRGVDADLVVRPFGWKGTEARLRRFIEDAARAHFGIQSQALVAAHVARADAARMGVGRDAWDPDGDGVTNELMDGAVTAGAVYLEMLEAPIVEAPRDARLAERWARGSALFDAAGCASCHVREMELADTSWRERADGAGGGGGAERGVAIDLARDGRAPKPALRGGAARVALFSDLKRHDMGDALADRHEGADGVARSVFLTRPLWGAADSAPYMHDGRAPTLGAAILAHDGEARAAREAYRAMSAADQGSVRVFLTSLTRAAKPRYAR